MRQYEISNFAKEGRESRHNLKYWTRQPYLGFGVDAHSMLRAMRTVASGVPFAGMAVERHGFSHGTRCRDREEGNQWSPVRRHGRGRAWL